MQTDPTETIPRTRRLSLLGDPAGVWHISPPQGDGRGETVEPLHAEGVGGLREEPLQRPRLVPVPRRRLPRPQSEDLRRDGPRGRFGRSI